MLDPVDVVDVFVTLKLASEVLLHDFAVLHDVAVLRRARVVMADEKKYVVSLVAPPFRGAPFVLVAAARGAEDDFAATADVARRGRSTCPAWLCGGGVRTTGDIRGRNSARPIARFQIAGLRTETVFLDLTFSPREARPAVFACQFNHGSRHDGLRRIGALG